MSIERKNDTVVMSIVFGMVLKMLGCIKVLGDNMFWSWIARIRVVGCRRTASVEYLFGQCQDGYEWKSI